jgi:uncharacterized repeat protein (TIGR04138 family)
MSASELTFWDAVDRIREVDPRYRPEAYRFVVAALGVTVQSLPAQRLDDPVRRHLSGRELLDGIIGLARREFGLMAPTVFAEWGVQRSEDVGRIVFQLVESGQLSARPEDRMDDFVGGPDLLDALRGPAGQGSSHR